MRAVGSIATKPIYLSDGASAVLRGWREDTRNLDFAADDDAVVGAIVGQRDRLNICVKRSSPVAFVPALPGWEERCVVIAAMVRDGLVEPKRLLALYREIEPELCRYPVVDPPTLRAAVEAFALQ